MLKEGIGQLLCFKTVLLTSYFYGMSLKNMVKQKKKHKMALNVF
ncbi:hypothetical protein CSC02_3166 [Enterobacter hormaechei subsp. hoffmannii]|nr:hypothetical protein CSC02_3166 [Enterobacter hormaechei subsp. hoffmannii]